MHHHPPARRARIGLRGQTVVAATLLALVLAACTGAPALTPTPRPTEEPPCGPTLTAAEMEGGFLAAELEAPAAGTIVEAVLAAGSDGGQLAGRTILFSGSFTGASLVTVAGGRVAAAELTTPGVSAPHCAGVVRAAVPLDVLSGAGKGNAVVEAQLGEIVVSGASMSCTAIHVGTGTIAVECPSLGIRIGDQASTGTLWLRLRSAGAAQVVTSLPEFVARLMGPELPTETAGSGSAIQGTVTLDGQTFPILNVASEFDGVVIEPRDGAIGYRAAFDIETSGNAQGLTVAISGYGTPGVRTEGTFVTLVDTTVLADGTFSSETYSARDCRVETGPDELTGSVSCLLTAELPATGTIDVAAEWTVASVRRTVGPLVHVEWTIGGAYVSEGQATVFTEINTLRDPSILRAAEVLVGHAGTFDLLRIDIRTFNGDGVYSGDAVDPSLQDVFEDSPNLRINAGAPTFDPALLDSRETWTPIFGACTATVTDDGASGVITCAGRPSFEDDRTAGSTTLVATWRPG